MESRGVFSKDLSTLSLLRDTMYFEYRSLISKLKPSGLYCFLGPLVGVSLYNRPERFNIFFRVEADSLFVAFGFDFWIRILFFVNPA